MTDLADIIDLIDFSTVAMWRVPVWRTRAGTMHADPSCGRLARSRVDVEYIAGPTAETITTWAWPSACCEPVVSYEALWVHDALALIAEAKWLDEVQTATEAAVSVLSAQHIEEILGFVVPQRQARAFQPAARAVAAWRGDVRSRVQSALALTTDFRVEELGRSEQPRIGRVRILWDACAGAVCLLPKS
jgi:hypothetical protein